jgi:hypothetical protein
MRMNPGTYTDLTLEQYLAVDAASKSRLWTLHSKTPAHCRVQREATPDMAWGSAAHVALLEPDRFAAAVLRGPADRRGKKWSEFLDANPGKLVLPEAEFDDVVAMQNAVMQNHQVKALTTRAGVSEASAFWQDPDSGVDCKIRPDRYVEGLSLMAELKTTNDASPDTFRRTAMRLGYDLGDALYTEGWAAAGGGEVEDFIFIVVEREPPYAHAIYQLDEPARLRGRTIMQKALLTYQQCKAAGQWGGYPAQVTTLSYPEWVYQEDAA